MKNEKKRTSTTGASKITVKVTMPEKEPGLYLSEREDSFKSKTEINIEAMQKGHISIAYPDREIVDLSFEELHEEFSRRAELRAKVENKEYNVTIEIQSDRPVAIGWFADVHTAGQDVDYERLKWEVDEIKRNPYMRVLLGGDLVDGFYWNPAQFGDVGNLDEQNLYLHKMLDYMGQDKILAGVMGSHEKWTRRTGIDSYNDIRKNIPIFDGIGAINLRINDIDYSGVIAHELKGGSYMNPNHQQKRFLMENGRYDFVFSAHTHNGAEQSQVFGGKKVVLLSGKTFKRADDFLDTKGFTRKTGDGIGTNWVIFSHDKFMMRQMSSTAEVLETMGTI